LKFLVKERFSCFDALGFFSIYPTATARFLSRIHSLQEPA
jgi:hypothetical protein